MAELFVWGSDWGLPSVDIASLELMTLIKFGNFPIPVKVTQASIGCKKGISLPCLVSNNDVSLHGREDVLTFLFEEGYNLDDWITPSQVSDLTAMKSYIKRKLHPYIAHMLWVISKHYTTVTRRTFSKLCRFPSNYVIPNSIYRSVKHSLENLQQDNDDEKDIADELYADAAECLNLFSHFLDDKTFLFGDRPSSLDAMLFASLAVLNKVPIQSDKLKSHLSACDNLCKLVGRVIQRHFKSNTTIPADNKPENDPKEEEWNKDWVIPSVVAVTAMLSYAAHFGLLHQRGTS